MAPSALNEHGVRTFSGPSVWASLAGSSALIVAFGVALVWAVQRYVHALDLMAARSPDAAILRAGISLKVLAAVMGLLAIGTALHTARSCGRVLAAKQIPPPGAWVLGNPTLISGDRAVLWGRVGYILAGVLAIVGAVITYLMWQFVDLMMSGIGTPGV